MQNDQVRGKLRKQELHDTHNKQYKQKDKSEEQTVTKSNRKIAETEEKSIPLVRC